MMHSRRFSLQNGLIIVLLMLVLSACQGQSPAEPTVYPPPPGNTGAAQPPEGYPGPATPTAYVIAEVPTPGTDTGTVVGYILTNKASPTPAGTVLLALARVIPGPDGTPMVASFNRNEAPHALTDANGRFVFSEVPPGQYALILDRISDAFMLNHPDSGEDFIVAVAAGEETDLGEIIYASLPGSIEGK